MTNSTLVCGGADAGVAEVEGSPFYLRRSRASSQDGVPSRPEIVQRTKVGSSIDGDRSDISSACGIAFTKASKAASSRQTDRVAYFLRMGSASIEKPITPSATNNCRRIALEPRNMLHVDDTLLGGILEANTRYSASASSVPSVFQGDFMGSA